MSVKPYFTKIDETILTDPEVEDLMEEMGVATFGVYVGLLTLFRQYPSRNFSIPLKDLKKIGKLKFNLSKKAIDKHVGYLIEKGFFHTCENMDGEVFFYSKRRQKELFEWQELTQKQSKSAEETNMKLKRGKYKEENG